MYNKGYKDIHTIDIADGADRRFDPAEEKELRSLKEIERRNDIGASRIASSRLDVLTVLSQTILRELDAIRSQEGALIADEVDLTREVQGYEESLIRRALIKSGGRQTQAAQLLNIKNTTLNAKIKRFGIDPMEIYQDAVR